MTYYTHIPIEDYARYLEQKIEIISDKRLLTYLAYTKQVIQRPIGFNTAALF